jgi:N utilization substance protein A
MAIISNFMAAVNQIAAERNIPADEVIESICEAIESNYQDLQIYTDNIHVFYSEEEDKIKAFAKKRVVQIAEDETHEVPLIQAILIDPDVKIGDVLEVDVTNEGDFGRVAAQSARQVLFQKVREIEKDVVLKSFEGKVGTVEDGIVQRLDGKNVIIEIRKALAIMPDEEKIPGEFYKSGSRIKVLVKEISSVSAGRNLIVSRADPDFLRALFVLEVPEIESDSIQIKSIAREPGSRSKVAVYSTVETLDPLGSCIGQKGVRIMFIMNALKYGSHEERVDVILWDPRIEVFVSNALSPAQVVKVKFYPNGLSWKELEEEIQSGKCEKKVTEAGLTEYHYDGFAFLQNESEWAVEPNTAKVVVPDEQLSLAIGKEGQNARLASKLTGVKVDIQGETERVNTSQKTKPATEVG